MSARLQWGRFVNWVGGKRRNAAQEICNCTSNNIAKEMGANRTPKAIIGASKSAAGVQQIVARFDANAHIHSRSNSNTPHVLQMRMKILYYIQTCKGLDFFLHCNTKKPYKF